MKDNLLNIHIQFQPIRHRSPVTHNPIQEARVQLLSGQLAVVKMSRQDSLQPKCGQLPGFMCNCEVVEQGVAEKTIHAQQTFQFANLSD